MWGEDVNICYTAKSDKYLFLADFFLLASEIQIYLQNTEMIDEKIKEFYLREH